MNYRPVHFLLNLRNSNEKMPFLFKPSVFFSTAGLNEISPGDLTDRKNIRNRLKCKDFDWYLRNIYPESTILQDYIAFGEVNDDFAKIYIII